MFYNLLNNVCAPLISFFIKVGGIMDIPFTYNFRFNNALYSTFINPLNNQSINIGTFSHYLDNIGIIGDIFWNVITFFTDTTVMIFPFVENAPTWVGFLFAGVLMGFLFALVGGIVRAIKALWPF